MNVNRFGHHEYVITDGQSHSSVSTGVSEFGMPMDYLYGDPNEAETVETTWWDSNYKYRRKMDIYSSVSGVSIPSGSIVMASIDVDTLYAQGKCLANYDDIRVVRYNAGWEELVRDFSDVPSHPSLVVNSSKFLFKTNEDIVDRDESYYLYYGNLGAGIPASGVVSVWDYQDDFSGASIGVDWTQDGTGNFTETGGYVQLQHTSVAYSSNGGWDDCPIIYKEISDEEIMIETKVTYEATSNNQGGIFVSDGTRNNAILFGLRDTGGTRTVQGSYVVALKLTDSGTVTGAVDYYYRLYITRGGGIVAWYSTNGTTWSLYGAWNVTFEVKWVGLYLRNTTTTNNGYQRFEYFYMTNRNIASMIDEEAPLLGNRMRGRKGFKNNALVPYNQF